MEGTLRWEHLKTTLRMTSTRKYNLRRHRVQPEELRLTEPPPSASDGEGSSPGLVDLRQSMPAVYDQGNISSCTANALCALVAYDLPHFEASRLFLYFNTRELEGTANQDAGTTLTDGVRALSSKGVCSEAEWPYATSKFLEHPPEVCYASAKSHVAVISKNLRDDFGTLQRALAAGWPFVVGIMVFASMESDAVAKTGNVPMPCPGEEILGGHAVVCVGYDDARQVWIMRNSWGPTWGDRGHFYLPYAYLIDDHLASDIWVVTSVTGS